ncbi:hypothetical protein ACFQFQ_09785 [Sulfitobacter porphyrae]|uniref:Uncharacterized protein n=1 Tax=Sulfitobacter porphyrae TaxID=1246864 RepID=A0ABW2B4B4_9RHOB|nr:hypothetical protein GCM10007928_25580 [Sulfitobacter porphyrae]
MKPLKNNIHKAGDLEFQMLYPPEGSTSILEVSDRGLGPFLHVSLRKDGDLTYEFFAETALSISEKQMKDIEEMARRKLSWTDLSAFGWERFDES